MEGKKEGYLFNISKIGLRGVQMTQGRVEKTCNIASMMDGFSNPGSRCRVSSFKPRPALIQGRTLTRANVNTQSTSDVQRDWNTVFQN